MSTTHLAPFPTIGFLRRRVEQVLGRPVELHRIEYVLAHRDIRPVGMAGRAKVYGPGAVELIVAELQRIEQRRVSSTSVEPVEQTTAA